MAATARYLAALKDPKTTVFSDMFNKPRIPATIKRGVLVKRNHSEEAASDATAAGFMFVVPTGAGSTEEEDGTSARVDTIRMRIDRQRREKRMSWRYE